MKQLPGSTGALRSGPDTRVEGRELEGYELFGGKVLAEVEVVVTRRAIRAQSHCNGGTAQSGESRDAKGQRVPETP